MSTGYFISQWYYLLLYSKSSYIMLYNSCNGKHDNMAKYIEAIYDGLNSSNNNITKAITNLHINKALYGKR